MSTDPASLYRQSLSSAQGDDVFSKLRRASLQAFAAEIPGLTSPEPQPVYVHMSDMSEPDHAAPAFQVGETLERLQRAVARLAKGRRTGASDVARIRLADVNDARLNVIATAPGSLIVKVQPHVEPQSDETLPLGTGTWAEQALFDLVRALPETEKDDDALDAIAVASPVMRRAISDLVLNRRGAFLDVELQMPQPAGEVLRSRLTPDHARALRRTLNIASEERHVETRRGRFDGVRTRRRIFYLETQAEGEIHGLVDEDLLEAVKRNIDRVVEVTLEVIVTRSRSGKASPRRYRLVAIHDDAVALPSSEAAKK